MPVVYSSYVLMRKGGMGMACKAGKSSTCGSKKTAAKKKKK
jgi:hypothetical protein